MATTAKDLIKRLQEIPQDAEIMFVVKDENGNNADCVLETRDDIWYGSVNNVTWFELMLESESVVLDR